MSKHTPGPWHRNIPPAAKYATIYRGRNTHMVSIHHAPGIPAEEQEANHDLIAAAPDLLRVAKIAATMLGGDDTGPDDEDDRDIWEIVHNAIAKAEGGAA